MREFRIERKDGKEIHKILSIGEIEFTNPIEFYRKYFIDSTISLEFDYFILKSPYIDPGYLHSFLSNRTVRRWEEEYKLAVNIELPKVLIDLLNTERKNTQVKLLHGFRITTYQLQSFIYYAWSQGFSFSQYKSQNFPNGTNNTELPSIFYIDNNGLSKIGQTNLSDGQLKEIIKNRKVVIAKFFDKKESWHCFFITYESIGGKESWENGQAHFHYISDKFGLDRQKVVDSLKSKMYKLGNLPHIALTDYGNQK